MSKNEPGLSQDYSSSPLDSLDPQSDHALSVPLCKPNSLPQAPDSDFLKHHVFSLDKDRLLSSLLNLVKPILGGNPDQEQSEHPGNGWEWLEQLIQMIFGKKSIRELQNDFRKLGIRYNHACGRLISSNQVFFRCLDCDQSQDTGIKDYAVLCTECFEKSEHKGHRVLTAKNQPNSSITCSCGVSSMLKKVGFCCEHANSEEKTDDVLMKFPEGFVENFLGTLRKAFYSVFTLYEFSEKAQNEQSKEALLALGQLAMEELLLFCTICYAEVNEAILIVLGILLRSQLPGECNLLWHNCDDLANNSESQNPHQCKCTILGLLFRFTSKSNEELQMKLHKILAECAKDNGFKSFLCEEFTKYSQYIFLTENEEHNQDHGRMSLINIQRQLYASEELREKVLETGHLDNLVKAMKRAVQNSFQNKPAVYEIIESISTILSSFLNPKSQVSRRLLSETNLLNDLLEILCEVQAKSGFTSIIKIGTHEHEVDYESINWSIKLEHITTQTLEQSFQLISEYPEQERSEVQKKFWQAWGSWFGNTQRDSISEFERKPVSFNTALERAFVLAMLNNSSGINIKAVYSFMGQSGGKHEAQDVSEQVLEAILKRLGAIRYLHLAHDYNTAAGLEAYYGGKDFCFEKDIVGIQLLSCTMERSDLFEVLAKHFFSYERELREFLLGDVNALVKDDYLRTKLLVLEDFLHFLVYITNDEICALNVMQAQERAKDSEKVTEKVLKNVLLGQYWVDITTLKGILGQVLGGSVQIEGILKRIAVFDMKTRKTRIRDEYKDELDPYLFYKMPAFQKEIINVMASKPNEKERARDLVSGKFNGDLPDYLRCTQKVLYESSLPEFLGLFVKNFNETFAPMTRPLLKLILTHLQLAKELDQGDWQSTKVVKKIAVNYLNEAFIEKLGELVKVKDLSDCKGCLDKIQELLKFFARNLGQESLYKPEDSATDTEKAESGATKKDLVNKRMQQLKEEFMKKQKMFMNKNSHLLAENVSTSTEEKHHIESQEDECVCQHCLEPLNEDSKTYGIPIHIGFTNNFYETEQEPKFKRDDYPERMKGNWWPVVSSCMHYYHEKCFHILYVNSRKSADVPVNYFSNEFETNCSLCKTLCNSFLTIRKQEKEKGDTEDYEHEQIRKQYPKLFIGFSEMVEELVRDLRRKLAAKAGDAYLKERNISAKEVTERAYSYYLESFSGLGKQQQKKASQLMENFLKAILQSCASDVSGNGLKDSASFFERLLDNSQGSPEAVLNDVCFGNLVSYWRKEASSKDGYLRDQLRLLKEYVALRTMQNLVSRGQSNPSSIEEALSLLSSSKEFQEHIIKQLSFPLQKLFRAALMNLTILYGTKNVKNDLEFSFLNKEELSLSELDSLVKIVFQEDIKFEYLVTEALYKLKENPRMVSYVFQNLRSDSLVVPIKMPRFGPKILKLPKTYAEFNSLYFPKKCSRCNQYSKNLSSCLCLICGKVVCLACCHKSETDRDYGNLNKHARKYHLGSSMFLEIQRLTKIIISSPVNSVYPGEDVYIDEYGQSVQSMIREDTKRVYAVDFSKFTLNQGYVEYVSNILGHHWVARETFTVSKVCGFYSHDNVL